MFLDFDDLHPEPSRLESALSRREGILLSLVAHASFVLLLLFGPSWDLFEAEDSPEILEVADLERPEEPLRFVEVVPLQEVPAPPPPPLAEQSDLDWPRSTQEAPPEPESIEPFSRGDTPEYTVGGSTDQPEAAEAADPTPEPEVLAEATPPTLPQDDGFARETPNPERPVEASRSLGNALRSLEQYLPNERFDNPDGQEVEQSTEVVFEDTWGIDPRPWWLRVKYQIERNWIMPPSAGVIQGDGLVRLCVLRNGRIVDLTVLRPAEHAAATNSVLNAFKLSNPTAALPAEYPADRLCMTVRFVYGIRH